MTNKTTEQTTQTSQHLPEVCTMKFVQHIDLSEAIIKRLSQDETKKKALYAYLEQSSIYHHDWDVWIKIREVFCEDIYDGVFLWSNECEEWKLEEIVNSCKDAQEKEFTKMVIAEYNILIAELNKAEGETVFIGVNW